MRRPKLIAVDLDGTLTLSEAWTEEECLNAPPNRQNIRKLNELAKDNFIIIFTARKDEFISATLEWLREHGVRFDAISNRKTPADIYIDSRAKRMEEVKGGD